MKFLSCTLLATLCLTFLSAPAPAIAAEAWGSSTIRYVYPMADGAFVLVFKDRNPACTNNGTGNDPYFWVRVGRNGVTAEGAKAILATALTAAAMKKPLTYAWDNADLTNCAINRISVEF